MSIDTKYLQKFESNEKIRIKKKKLSDNILTSKDFTIYFEGI